MRSGENIKFHFKRGRTHAKQWIHFGTCSPNLILKTNHDAHEDTKLKGTRFIKQTDFSPLTELYTA